MASARVLFQQFLIYMFIASGYPANTCGIHGLCILLTISANLYRRPICTTATLRTSSYK